MIINPRIYVSTFGLSKLGAHRIITQKSDGSKTNYSINGLQVVSKNIYSNITR